MKKRILLGFICAVGLFLLMISSEKDIVRLPAFLASVNSEISCYCDLNTFGSQPYFDASAEPESLKEGKNIFFHETSCFTDGLQLNARQACAVESAARINPNRNVYLLFVSGEKVSNRSRKLFEQLQLYPNIKIRRIIPLEYAKNTPLEKWYASDVLKKSHWPRSHMSDILRYLTLWKYGGIYLDLDVVVTQSLEGLSNFAGAEDGKQVAAGVLGFDVNDLGRRVAYSCIRDLKKNFRGNVWGNNGPGVITRTLQKLCGTNNARDMTTGRCHDFKVFPPSTFYPIHYENWKKYFETKDANATMKLLENALAIHVWNKLSSEEELRVDMKVPYAIIAKKYCPNVFDNCGKTF